jgi:hypothetical protein
MEKTNWIEKVKEAVRVAMNKGLEITEDSFPQYKYIIEFENGIEFKFDIQDNLIKIFTPKGKLFVNHNFTDREQLEIQALVLSIKEYNEDMAISEFEEFISEEKVEITDINNLDDDD